MATSGSFAGNSLSWGYGPNYIFTNWQLASQNTAGNYSTINWQTYFHFGGDDVQLDNGVVNSNVGNLWTNSGRVYNYAGNFSTRDMGLASGSFTIGADAAGNSQLQLANSIAVYQEGTSAATSGVWDLPQIPRYANIDGWQINNFSDEWIEFAWHADRTCDYISWWSTAYDGGGHHDIPVGDQGWWTIDIHNLKSGTAYDVTVAVRNAASGLWTTSSTLSATTNAQNNFVGRRVI